MKQIGKLYELSSVEFRFCWNFDGILNDENAIKNNDDTDDVFIVAWWRSWGKEGEKCFS